MVFGVAEPESYIEIEKLKIEDTKWRTIGGKN